MAGATGLTRPPQRPPNASSSCNTTAVCSRSSRSSSSSRRVPVSSHTTTISFYGRFYVFTAICCCAAILLLLSAVWLLLRRLPQETVISMHPWYDTSKYWSSSLSAMRSSRPCQGLIGLVVTHDEMGRQNRKKRTKIIIKIGHSASIVRFVLTDTYQLPGTWYSSMTGTICRHEPVR